MRLVVLPQRGVSATLRRSPTQLLRSLTRTRTYARTRTRRESARDEFECFPYVCPEPVLVK
jgi:hypothetical protein